jgi:NTE family protein
LRSFDASLKVAFMKCRFHPSGFLTAILSLAIFAQLAACVAHYPVNNPIRDINLDQAFTLEDKRANRSDELLLILTFSGGGTRAAAFAYGVLQTFADTQIIVDGQKRRLLDEVDAISSVSGGSFTAAYFGLFRDRIFEDFETKFLKRNVQSELTWRVLSPLNWPKLASLHYERSDLAAEFYDEILFEKKTFQDFIASGGPLIAINATNVALGSQFTFTGPQFEPICTDLGSYPVSRAVTASSAVPGVFSSIIIRNFAGSCGYVLPEWAKKALEERKVNTRRYHMAKMLREYSDRETQPFVHLLDGGLSDNLGIRLIINSTEMEGSIWNKLKKLNLEKTRRLAIIVVNAQSAINTSFNKRDYSIPIVDALGPVSSIPLDQNSFETMELLRNNIKRWRDSITAGRCKGETAAETGMQQGTVGAVSACAARTYLVEVDFDELSDETERTHLKNLPTSFYLKPEDVDRLKAAAQKILTDSVEFQKFVHDMQ